MQKVFDASFGIRFFIGTHFPFCKLFDKLKVERFNIDRMGFERYKYDAESVWKGRQRSIQANTVSFEQRNDENNTMKAEKQSDFRMIYGKQSIFYSNKGIYLLVVIHAMAHRVCLYMSGALTQGKSRNTKDVAKKIRKKVKKLSTRVALYRITNLTQMESVWRLFWNNPKCRDIRFNIYCLLRRRCYSLFCHVFGIRWN